MRNLHVYADFDWLETPTLIGKLYYDSVRGNEIYGFAYDNEWLINFGDIFLSEDILQIAGKQFTPVGKDGLYRRLMI